MSSSDMSWVALSNAGCRWLPFPRLVCYPADHSQNWWSERRCNEIRCGLGSSEYSCLCRSLRRLRVNSRHVCLSNLPQHVPTCPQHIFCRRLFKSAALMRKDTKSVFHDAILLYWFIFYIFATGRITAVRGSNAKKRHGSLQSCESKWYDRCSKASSRARQKPLILPFWTKMIRCPVH